MTTETDYLIQTMFDGENLEEMPLDELRILTEKYPYSSIIQFLYTCKLKSIYHTDFPESVTKTAIFFNDPYWLNFQLSEETERGNIKKSGYEYNLQERIEEAKNAEATTLDTEQAWQDEDGYSFSGDGSEQTHLENGAVIPQNDETVSNNDDFDSGFQDDLPLTDQFNFPQFKMPEPDSSSNLDVLIPIEPYHTVDYFASQGIKLSHTFEKDELGTKVKSFTDWLRTMKKLQPDTLEVKSKDIVQPQQVKSEVHDPAQDIITEAIAEVYLKQGLKEKAIEVYNKLSLQNPANKHIFVAKISLIKENNL